MLRFLLLFVVVAISATAIYYGSMLTRKLTVKPAIASVTDSRNKTELRLEQYAAGLKVYTAKKHFNTRYCFLIDMQLPSGSRRFFVYDLQKDLVLHAGLVTHGSGLVSTDSIVFSNSSGSNCSSLGRYRIGKPYHGKFGLAYKLYGLDPSNSNAFNRFVVLHSHACVPDDEVAPLFICKSWGCPTVSPAFLNTLKTYIDRSAEPVLLSIYH